MTDNTTTPAPSKPVAGPVQRPVRPLVDKLRDCAQGIDLGADGMGWSPDPALLREAADEIERLAGVVKKANDQAEHFERLWYLTNEDAGRYAFAKTLEGQVVTMGEPPDTERERIARWLEGQGQPGYAHEVRHGAGA